MAFNRANVDNFYTVVSGLEEYKLGSPVPGVGPITGLRVVDDVVYATRSDGSVMVEWQAAGDGWVPCTKGKIQIIQESILDDAKPAEVVGPNARLTGPKRPEQEYANGTD